MDEPESLNRPPPIAGTPRPSSLATLLRLWTLRTAALAVEPSARFLAALSGAWLILWLAIDWWQAQPDPRPVEGGVPLFAWYVLAVLALAAVLRWSARPTPSFPAALLLALGLVPLPLLIASIVAPFLPPALLLTAIVALLIYVFIFLARGLRSFTGQSQRRAAIAGLAFFIGFVWLSDVLDVIPDVWATPEVEETADNNNTQADAEALLFDQSARIDQALAAIKPDTA